MPTEILLFLLDFRDKQLLITTVRNVIRRVAKSTLTTVPMRVGRSIQYLGCGENCLHRRYYGSDSMRVTSNQIMSPILLQCLSKLGLSAIQATINLSPGEKDQFQRKKRYSIIYTTNHIKSNTFECISVPSFPFHKRFVLLSWKAAWFSKFFPPSKSSRNGPVEA